METINSMRQTYAIKEVPDIFYCNENGEVLFMSRTAKSVEFQSTVDDNNIKCWSVTINDMLGDLETWFDIQDKINHNIIKEIYFRTYARNMSGEDIPYCFKICPIEIKNIKQGLAADGEIFNYVIKFLFYIIPEKIDEWACPNYGRDESTERLYIIDANKGAIKLSKLREKMAETKIKQRGEPIKRFID